MDGIMAVPPQAVRDRGRKRVVDEKLQTARSGSSRSRTASAA
jgi:hypothetical protein